MTDVNELKLEHYRQRVLQQEEQIATLRAELTNASEQVQALQAQAEAGPVNNEVVQGEVVSDVPD